jgi:epoxyqueuosine reductase
MEINFKNKIKNKAIELGYESCGIIQVNEMKDYSQKLTERINKFPEIKPYTEEFYSFANLENDYPWAKSVIVCTRIYGKYKIPNHLDGLIGKYYLVDSRTNENSKDYQDSISFENYLNKLGLKTATDRKFGVTALRWAAHKAGLGIIRKNNFFYSASGSWVYLEAWIIDQTLTLKENINLKNCPPNCNLCIKACPTNSLLEPYTMNRNTCVSCLTTWRGWDLPNERYNRSIGKWIYGCDICQDICPFNKDKWSEENSFPDLEKLSVSISLEKIIEMDYDFLRDIISTKFWYISKYDVWRWKTNALNAMLNTYNPSYDKYIDIACHDEDIHVQKMAIWVKGQLSLRNN